MGFTWDLQVGLRVWEPTELQTKLCVYISAFF